MPHLTIEELEQLSGVPSATLNRRLKFIKENDTATYATMLQKQGRTKLYEGDAILPKLKDWKAYLATLSKPTAAALAAAPFAPVVEKRATTARKPPAAPTPPPRKRNDPEREKRLTALLETPVVILAPDPETKRIYERITDPIIKERVEYAIRICASYATGEFSLEQCTEAEGVPVRTFNYWVNQNTEVAALYKRARMKARRSRAQELGDEAQHGLLRLVRGEEWDEDTVIYKEIFNPDGTTTRVPISRRTTRRKTHPNTAAVIFALTNVMPRLFQNKFQHQVGPTQTQLKQDEIDKMSPAEREQMMLEVFKDKMVAQLMEAGWKPPQS